MIISATVPESLEPTQVSTWHPKNFSGVGKPDIAEGAWLRCLRDTSPGDRLIVWEGAAGRGLVAVVDFGQQRRSPAPRVFEGWGRVQQLNPPISIDAIHADPLLSDRFNGRRARGLQGSPKRLSSQESAAIGRLAASLPVRANPVDEPTYNEEIIFWAGDENGPPEAVLEHDIHTTRRLWKALGFPNAPEKQRRLMSGLRPDLIAPGVVVDVKRRITRIDGPSQVEGYIEELDRTRPEHGPWRGLLVHSHEQLDVASRERIVGSSFQLEAWVVTNGRFGRRHARRIA